MEEPVYDRTGRPQHWDCFFITPTALEKATFTTYADVLDHRCLRHDAMDDVPVRWDCYIPSAVGLGSTPVNEREAMASINLASRSQFKEDKFFHLAVSRHVDSLPNRTRFLHFGGRAEERQAVGAPELYHFLRGWHPLAKDQLRAGDGMSELPSP